MSKEFVVSGNYRDKENKNYPWLIRKTYHDIDGAVPTYFVDANDVEFRESPNGESGFGCTVVAYCADAVFNEITPTGVVLEAVDFDGFNFIKRLNGETVRSCKRLVLEPNGDMFIVSNDEPTN